MAASTDSDNGGALQGSSTNMLSGATGCSVAFWFNMSSNTSANENFIGQWGDTATNWIVWLTNTDDRITFSLAVGSFIKAIVEPTRATMGIDVGEWHHWCWTWLGSGSFVFYLDGVSQTLNRNDTDGSAITTGTGEVYQIGRRGTDDLPSDGLYCECQVFDKELSINEVNEIMYNPVAAVGMNCVSWVDCRADTGGVDLVSGQAMTLVSTVASTEGPPVSYSQMQG